MSLSRNKERLLARLKGGRSRAKEGLFVVEGVRGSEEALAREADIRFAVCSSRLQHSDRGLQLARRLEGAVGDLVWVDEGILEAAAHTETPQGVLLVCAEPSLELSDLKPGDAPEPGAGPSPLRLLVLDGIQDPGNLGSLIRGAAAFGLAGVVALSGTVDPWNSKAVRASAGACFSIPVVRASGGEFFPWCRTLGLPVLVADMAGRAAGPLEGTGWVLVIGSEAEGPSSAAREAAGEFVAVPMSGSVESLNAAMAGGILMFAMTRGSESR
jgi:TrmH family RNA methyltransferase